MTEDFKRDDDLGDAALADETWSYKGIEVKWDATKEGLKIGFDAEGERHHAALSWTRIEEMRQEMVRDIWALVPKITEGVGHADTMDVLGDLGVGPLADSRRE